MSTLLKRFKGTMVEKPTLDKRRSQKPLLKLMEEAMHISGGEEFNTMYQPVLQTPRILTPRELCATHLIGEWAGSFTLKPNDSLKLLEAYLRPNDLLYPEQVQLAHNFRSVIDEYIREIYKEDAHAPLQPDEERESKREEHRIPIVKAATKLLRSLGSEVYLAARLRLHDPAPLLHKQSDGKNTFVNLLPMTIVRGTDFYDHAVGSLTELLTGEELRFPRLNPPAPHPIIKAITPLHNELLSMYDPSDRYALVSLGQHLANNPLSKEVLQARLNRLTWESLLDLAHDAQEYNMEWAVLSF